MQQYRIRCHKNGNIAAFTIKNFTKDQLFLTEYLQNKLHSFNELIYFPKNQGFYRILKQKQVVFDTTFQKWEGNNGNKRSYHTTVISEDNNSSEDLVVLRCEESIDVQPLYLVSAELDVFDELQMVGYGKSFGFEKR